MVFVENVAVCAIVDDQPFNNSGGTVFQAGISKIYVTAYAGTNIRKIHACWRTRAAIAARVIPTKIRTCEVYRATVPLIRTAAGPTMLAAS